MIAPYLARPLLMLAALALVCAPLSTLVNLRRAEFSAEAMVHGVFPGIVIGVLVGGREAILPGAAICGVGVGAALTWATRRMRSSEAATAVILTSFFSLGIVISLRWGDMSGQLEALMFGRLLDITSSRLYSALIVMAISILILALTWKRQVAVAFDRSSAGAQGISTLGIDALFHGALAGAVVASSAAVGVLLVITFLVVPGACGRLLASSVPAMNVIAGGSALVGAWGGFALSLLPSPRPLSPQACVALGVLLCFAMVVAVKKVRP